jgi:hypothetical protein
MRKPHRYARYYTLVRQIANASDWERAGVLENALSCLLDAWQEFDRLRPREQVAFRALYPEVFG